MESFCRKEKSGVMFVWVGEVLPGGFDVAE